MSETREVTLTLRLPLDFAARAEAVHADEPEFLERVVLYGLTRRSIYRHLQEASREGGDDVVPGDTTPMRSVSVQPIPEEEGRAILAENRQHIDEARP